MALDEKVKKKTAQKSYRVEIVATYFLYLDSKKKAVIKMSLHLKVQIPPTRAKVRWQDFEIPLVASYFKLN
jgi:hypothetical protein